MRIAPYTRQPDAFTCQSACIAQMLGMDREADVYAIREELKRMGVPGDPAVMGRFLRSRVDDRGLTYRFDIDASLNDARKALDDGCKLITHGWYTRSGHVVSIVGYEPNPNTLGIRFIVDDPWAEFDFPSWRYLNKTGNDVRYSAHGMFATCVAGQSFSDAQRIFKNGTLDSNRGGMWLHIIGPK